jgi:predicted lipoprotein with Yx(FWY)xxD motif
MRPSHLRVLAATGVAAFALAACGSSSKASSPPSTAPATTAAPSATSAPSATTAPANAPAAGSTTVKLASTKLGMVLVSDKGLTLYRFDNDTTPGKSTCGPGVCASTWPALTVTGMPTAGPGIEASKLSTFMRADGMTQVQIEGHPLYMFAGDKKAGDTNGQGLLDKWYAVTADGDKAGDKS